MTMELLTTAGIGRVVNKLRSRGGVVGKLAERVVITWTFLVKKEITEQCFSKENCSP